MCAGTVDGLISGHGPAGIGELESNSVATSQRKGAKKMDDNKKMTEEIEGQELDIDVEPTAEEIAAAEAIYGKAVEE